MARKKLYGNASEPRCETCLHGKLSSDGDSILCQRGGVLPLSHHCRHFQYDPLRRTPRRVRPLEEFDAAEFALDDLSAEWLEAVSQEEPSPDDLKHAELMRKLRTYLNETASPNVDDILVLLNETPVTTDDTENLLAEADALLSKPANTQPVTNTPSMEKSFVAKTPSAKESVFDGDTILEEALAAATVAQTGMIDEAQEPITPDETISQDTDDAIAAETTVADREIEQEDIATDDEAAMPFDDTEFEEDISEEPTAFEDVLEEPAVIEDVFEEPAVTEDVLEEPAVIEDVFEEPAVAEDVFEEPAVIEDVFEEPAVTEDVFEEPSTPFAAAPVAPARENLAAEAPVDTQPLSEHEQTPVSVWHADSSLDISGDLERLTVNVVQSSISSAFRHFDLKLGDDTQPHEERDDIQIKEAFSDTALLTMSAESNPSDDDETLRAEDLIFLSEMQLVDDDNDMIEMNADGTFRHSQNS